MKILRIAKSNRESHRQMEIMKRLLEKPNTAKYSQKPAKGKVSPQESAEWDEQDPGNQYLSMPYLLSDTLLG